jgi:hypothetical protein
MDQIQIADYLAKKVFNKELESVYYIMLKNKQIYYIRDYGKLIEPNKISPEDAFAYIDSRNYSRDDSYYSPVAYLFPLIDTYGFFGIVRSYLSKLGFYRPVCSVYPATGLKYYGAVVLFYDRLVVEFTDIDTMATNTGLRKIVIKVLGKDILTQKKISDGQIEEIFDKFDKQKVFAGYPLSGGYISSIIKDYYIKHNTSLAKEVLAIANAYNRVFEPYRVVYDTTTRQQVLI